MDLRRLIAWPLLCVVGCAAGRAPGEASDAGAAGAPSAVDAPALDVRSADPPPRSDARSWTADARGLLNEGRDAASDGAGGAVVDAAAAPFDPCPPAGTPCRVMPFGDSLTFGVGSAGAGYRVPLFRKVIAGKQSLVFVGSEANGPATVDGVPFPRAHEGYRGYAIFTGGGRMGIAPLVERAVGAHKPHVVLLLAGTNDVGAEIIDAPHAPDRLGALVDRIAAAAPATLIVVAQIPPSKDDATNARIEAFNAALPAVVKARTDAGKHVLLVDAYGALTAQAGYKATLMFNEFHPNDAGYALIAERWYAALRPFLR